MLNFSRLLRQSGLVVVLLAALPAPALSRATAQAEPRDTAQPSAQDFYDRGIAERKNGRPDDAIVLLSLAAAREPDNANIRLQLALAFMAARRVDAAERQLRRAERIAPDSADVDIALAYVDLFQGRKVDAAMRTSRLLRKHPEREDVISLAKSFERKTTPPTSTNVRPAGLRLVTFDGSLPGTQDQRRARSKRTYALSYRLQPS